MTLRRLLAALVLTVLLSCVAACGGDDDEEESIDPLETYLTQLSAIVSIGNVQVEGLADRYPTAFEDVEVTKDYYAEYVDSYARFLAGTKQIPPPAEVSAEHNEYVAASEAVLQGNHARLSELETATTIDEVSAIFADDPEYTTAVQRQDTACQALKTLGEQNGVSVPGLGDCNNFN